jgi:hypothetical protein
MSFGGRRDTAMGKGVWFRIRQENASDDPFRAVLERSLSRCRCSRDRCRQCAGECRGRRAPTSRSFGARLLCPADCAVATKLTVWSRPHGVLESNAGFCYVPAHAIGFRRPAGTLLACPPSPRKVFSSVSVGPLYYATLFGWMSLGFFFLRVSQRKGSRSGRIFGRRILLPNVCF